MAANCPYTSTYSLGCRDNIAGVQKVYLRAYSASTTYTYDASTGSTAGTITGSTASNAGCPWYSIEQRMETSNFLPGTGTHSLENGTNFWTQQLDLTFTKYQASLRTLVYSLALSELDVIVYTQNGDYIQMGEVNGANLTASVASVGKAFGDLNGATTTLTAKEPTPARPCSAAYITAQTFL